ncbi:MAG: hypothetical protein IPJ69_00120 [Deltaproteobacteria bacterium]|nr:MAG: hypothetical protein IPJ69_00120 [Deltaproteobacteria bacterium]
MTSPEIAEQLKPLLSFKDKIDKDPKLGVSVLEMIFEKPVTDPLDYDDLLDCMSFLEEPLVEADSLFALKIMICLYPIADKHYAHDICDAIDLWIYETPMKELIPFIQKYLEIYPTTPLKAIGQDWIKQILKEEK